jgi:Na+/H+ antiporter NhaD/arsenite permease-like protein
VTIALIDMFAVLTAAAGWYYMFYSRAAQNLEPLEARQLNRARVRLRRIGGGFMMLLGVLFFAGFQNLRPMAYIAVWIGVLIALAAIVILALIDMRLTWKLQKHRRRPPP